MSCQEGNERPQSNNDEEWETSDSRDLPNMWYKNVQDREELRIVPGLVTTCELDNLYEISSSFLFVITHYKHLFNLVPSVLFYMPILLTQKTTRRYYI